MSIPLNKDGGLEPHTLLCRCGKSAGLTIGVIMVGEDSHGNKHMINRGGGSRFNAQRRRDNLEEVHGWTHVPEDQREIVSNTLCKDCEDEQELHREIVSNGGIYFKCEKCPVTGVLKASSELAIAVRKQTPAPAPIGIEFEECSQHTPDD